MIIGAQSYDSPIGCAPDSVFNLVAGTEITTLASTNGGSPEVHGFTVTNGVAFQIPVASINADMWVATSTIQPVSFIGSLQFNTAGVPDIRSAYSPIPISGDKILLHVAASGPTCGGTSCLHLYIFNSGPAIDTTIVFPSLAVGAGEGGGIYDGTHYFFINNTSSGSGRLLFKFDSGLSFIQSINVGNVTSDVVDDGVNVWIVNQILPGLSSINKDTMIRTNFTVPAVSSSAQRNIQINRATGDKYIIDGAGTFTVKRISSSNVVTGNISIGTDVPNQGALMYDERAQKLYVVADNVGNKRIRRINPFTFTVEQTLTIPSGNSNYSSAPDFIHKFIWISDVDTPSHVQRVQLCT